MKIKIIALAILFGAIVFSGCKKVDEALDVTFDATFKTNLNIDIPAGTEIRDNGVFDETESIDPTTDENVKKYLDKIKGIEVNGITVTVTSITKNITLTDLRFSVKGDAGEAVWEIPSLAVTEGTVATLGNESGQWDMVNTILGEKKIFTVSASGVSSEDDVQFTFEYVINTKITANPL
jgi:hypothetical protein